MRALDVAPEKREIVAVRAPAVVEDQLRRFVGSGDASRRSRGHQIVWSDSELSPLRRQHWNPAIT